MVMIQNGFDLGNTIQPDKSYRIWTKEPLELAGQCLSTDYSRTRSFSLHGITEKNHDTYRLKKELPDSGFIPEYLEVLDKMIGFFHDPGNKELKAKPLGSVLNPESYAVARALYVLVSVLSFDYSITDLSLDNTDTEPTITDLVIRDIVFSPDQFTEQEKEMLTKAGHIPAEFVALQMTTDLYSR